MIIHDISLPISKESLVWPGDPEVALRRISTIKAGDSSNVSQIEMSVHTGTHIDAPRHFIDSGKTIDAIPLEKLIGEALVMAIPDSVETISEEVLIDHPHSGMLNRVKKVLFKTRNSSY